MRSLNNDGTGCSDSIYKCIPFNSNHYRNGIGHLDVHSCFSMILSSSRIFLFIAPFIAVKASESDNEAPMPNPSLAKYEPGFGKRELL